MHTEWCDAEVSNLSVATKGQVNGQWKNIVHKLLEGVEKEVHLFIGNAEAKKHTDSHLKWQVLRLTVHIDGFWVGAPHTQSLLNHLLDLRQVAFKRLMAEDFSEDLAKRGTFIQLQLLIQLVFYRRNYAHFKLNKETHKCLCLCNAHQYRSVTLKSSVVCK